MTTIIGVGALVWVVCGIAAAAFAGQRGRSQAGWFVGGVLFGPVGLLLLLSLPVGGHNEASGRGDGPVAKMTLRQKRVMVVVIVLLVVPSLAVTGYLWQKQQRLADAKKTMRDWAKNRAANVSVAQGNDYYARLARENIPVMDSLYTACSTLVADAEKRK